MDQFITHLIQSYGYVIVFLLVGIESLGIPLPGETALLVAAAFAALGHLDIYVVIAFAAAGAIIGDNTGYWIGRKGGMALIRRYGRKVHLTPRKVERVWHFFDRYGPKAVFFGRFIAVLRTWVAVFAGTAHMAYGRFMLFNALGGVVWSIVVGVLGYMFGSQLSTLKHYMNEVTLVVLAVIVAAVVVIVLVRRAHEHRTTP
ncbi:MAG TPA: DedA family protein [Gemmatimonadaceae bacterium]